MTSTTAAAAKLLTKLVTAEDALRAARAKEARTARAAERAAARVAKARTAKKDADKARAAAERDGKRIAAATARAERAAVKLDQLRAAAADARQQATEARRAARAAARRLDTLSRRAATAAATAVGDIAHRLGEQSLTATAPEDRTLPAEELPAVEEIEKHADRFADLDAQAKAYAKAADAEKKWLRQLPVGTYGRAVVTRTAGRSILDGDQVALDYLNLLGTLPPRKGSRSTFKVAVAAAEPAAAEAGDVITLAA
jgi:hypothetical protein